MAYSKIELIVLLTYATPKIGKKEIITVIYNEIIMPLFSGAGSDNFLILMSRCRRNR